MEERLNQLSFISAAFIGLMIAGAYYFFLFQPSRPEAVLSRIDRQMQDAGIAIKELDQKIRKKQELNTQAESLRQSVNSLERYIPKVATTADAAALLSQEARSAGLAIQSLTEGRNWQPQDAYETSKVSIVSQGNFAQLMHFLSELTRQKNIFTVMSANLTGLSQNRRNEEVSGLLSVNLRVMIYKQKEVIDDSI